MRPFNLRRAISFRWAGVLLAAICGCASEHGALKAFLRPDETQVASGLYVVRPPDAIRIHAPAAPEVDGAWQTVRADGKVVLRLLGEVDVAGLTTAQIADKLRTQLARYYIEPEVAVELAAARSKFYYVFGEVQNPGPRLCTGRDTLTRAIAEARPTFLAWKAKIRLIRPNPTESARKIIEIDFDKLVHDGDASRDVLLQEGDVIEVPPTPLAWVGLRVRELLYPVTPVMQAYQAPADVLDTNNTYEAEWGDHDDGGDNRRWWRRP